MTDSRLYGVIRAFEQGKLAFARFAELDRQTAIELTDAPRIAETCHKHKVVVGNPHIGAKNVERLVAEGYRFLVSAPARSYGVVGQGRELTGY